LIVFRKNTSSFYSIENVFEALLPFLEIKKNILPHASKGLINRLKNIFFIYSHKSNLLHITGNDHYLLCYPFENTILTIHDIEALKRKSGLKKWIFKKLWFDIPIQNAKVITTISKFSRREILSLGNYTTPIKVIHNPLTLPMVHSPKVFNTKKTRILHMGTKKNKNLVRTIKALRGIDCWLTIVGKPETEILDLLKINRIHYSIKSNLNKVEIMGEYINCDLVSFVSTYEGFGLPIIEGQATGRPVLTSNVASMPEVAGTGALFVNPFSVKAIRAGINKLIANEDLREDLIKKGLKNVERFKPKVIAGQYLKLYGKVLNH